MRALNTMYDASMSAGVQHVDHRIIIRAKLFNRSLQEQFVPCYWKLANITPIPKESP